MFFEVALVLGTAMLLWFTAPLTARLYALPSQGSESHAARVKDITRVFRHLSLFFCAAGLLISVMMRVFPSR